MTPIKTVVELHPLGCPSEHARLGKPAHRGPKLIPSSSVEAVDFALQMPSTHLIMIRWLRSCNVGVVAPVFSARYSQSEFVHPDLQSLHLRSVSSLVRYINPW